MHFLVIDNDTLFTRQFCSILEDDGVQVVRSIGIPSSGENQPNPATALRMRPTAA